MDIIVKSQKELDAVPVDTKDTIIIEFGTDESPAIITKRYVHPVEVHGNYVVTAYYSWIKACDNSTVETYGNSYIHAFGNSLVVTYDNSTVWAHESSSVWANDNSIVVVCNNNCIKAHDNSQCIKIINTI